MTHKERVIAALKHREADRVPNGEYGSFPPMIDEVLGRPSFLQGKRRLTEALWDGRRDEVVDGMKRDLVEYVLKMDVDMVPVWTMAHKDYPISKPKQIAPDMWEDASGNILKYSAETGDIGVHKASSKGFPQADFQLPAEPDESEMELVHYVMEKLGKTHFIFAKPGRFQGIGFISGWAEEQFIRFAEDPEGIAREELADAENLRELAKPFAQAGVDAILIGADYGYNSGPFVSPQTFSKVHAPAMKRRCDIIHEFGLPCLFHSCGNNRLILDQMVDAGMDAYQSIQPVNRIEEIKQLFGDRITLWGGVSTDTLRRGTPDEVRRQVLFTLKHCAPCGGLILCSSHTLVVGTPLRNYRVMLDTLRERGNYPIRIPEETPQPSWGSA